MAKNKTLRRLSVLLAFAAVSQASPVLAGSWDDVGGDPSDSNKEIVTYKRGEVICKNGEGWYVEQGYNAAGNPVGLPSETKRWDKNYTQCTVDKQGTYTFLRTTQLNKEQFQYCQTHWEVWRFYGTRGTPVKGYTVSRVNFRDWCEPSVNARFYSPNPADAGGPSPFVSSYGKNAAGESVATIRSAPGFSTGLFTTAAPFRFEGTSCAALRASDTPFAENTEWAKTNLESIYNGYLSRENSETARYMSNLKTPTPLTWEDGVPCTSGAEFSRPAAVTDADPNATPVYGTCYVKVNRIAAVFTGPRGDWLPNWPTYTIHRYVKEPGVRFTTPQPYEDVWRQQIVREVQTRGTNTGKPGTSARWTPGDPYNASNALLSSIDVNAAAATAATSATCVDESFDADGPTTTTTTTTPTTTPPPVTIPNDAPGAIWTPSRPAGPSIYYTLTVPRSFFVAGTPTTQKVTGVISDYLCTGAGCTSEAIDRATGRPLPRAVVSNDISIRLGGTGGFSQFREASSYENADNPSCNKAAPFNASRPSANCGISKELEFYRATESNQGLVVEVSGTATLITFENYIARYEHDRSRPSCPYMQCRVAIYQSRPVYRNVAIIFRLKYEDSPTLYAASSATRPVYSASAVWR
jgi:hypothetical protein